MDEILVNISSSTENINVTINEFRGRSAYQVWLDAGNVGTETDFFIYLSNVGTSASLEELYENKGRGILSGSVLNYIPVIVSGSSQINIFETQNFTTVSSSIDLRIDNLELFSSSLNVSFATDTELRLTASAIEDKINTTASLFNTFSSSINDTIKTKLNVEGAISGSSQLTGSYDTRYELQGRGVLSGSVLNYIPLIVSQSSQIQIDGVTDFSLYSSSVYDRFNQLNFTSGSSNSRLDSLELESGSVRNRLSNIEQTTSSLNSFSSSINDTIKTKLNIENVVSGSSQIQLSQITGNTFGSSTFTFPQDLIVQGKLTAQEFYTEYVTSSVIYESGSTKFGDTLDDTHQFTGSLLVNGNVSINGGITGSLSGTADTASYIQWNSIDNKPIYVSQSVYMNDSQSIDTKFNTIQLFTQSIDLRADNLESTTQSLNISVTNINEFTQSANLRLQSLEYESGSVRFTLDQYTASVDVRLNQLEFESESVRTTLNQYSQSTDNRLFNLENTSESINSSLSNIHHFTSSADSRLDSLEYESGSIRNEFNQFTQSYTTTSESIDIRLDNIESFTSSIDTTIKTKLNSEGVISGSAQLTSSYDTRYELQGREILSGSVLNYIPVIVSQSSQIQLNQITGTTFSASNFTFPQDLVVGGKLTAQEYYTEYITSSVILESGSTKFGNTIDDTHKFTGSVFITGSFEVNGQTNLSRDLIISTNHTLFTTYVSENGPGTGISYYAEGSGHRFTGSVSITGSLTLNGQPVETGRLDKNVFYAFTASYNDYTESVKQRLLNIETETGSLRTELNSYTQSIDIRLDSIELFTSSINTTIKSKLNTDGVISGSSQLTSSYDQRYILSGSITETTWDNIANKPSGIVSGSSQLTSSFDTRYAFSGSGVTLPSGLISGSSQLTSSYDTRYERQGSTILSGSVLNYIPVIVSGSSQIDVTQTQNYSTLATTGSNIFNGNQTINGDLEVSIDTIILTGSMYVSGTIEVIGSITGSLNGTATSASYVDYLNVGNKPTLVSGSDQLTASLDLRYAFSGSGGTLPSGLISGSSQLTSSYDTRYELQGRNILSGSVLNYIPVIVSSSSQIDIYNTTNYNEFSSSLNNTNLSQSLRFDNIELFTESIDSRVDSIEITTSSINLRLDNLETESGSIRNTFNQFTSSYNTGSFLGDLIGTASYAVFAISASYIDGGFY